jgi:hypothetical protein
LGSSSERSQANNPALEIALTSASQLEDIGFEFFKLKKRELVVSLAKCAATSAGRSRERRALPLCGR